MTEDEAKEIWDEIKQLQQELKSLTLDRSALIDQATELRQLSEELHVSANRVVAAAKVAEQIIAGKDNTDEAQA